MDRRVTRPKPGYLLSGPPPPPCKQALSQQLSQRYVRERRRVGNEVNSRWMPRLPSTSPPAPVSPPPTPHPHEQPVYSHSLFERRGGLHTGYRATVRSELSKNVW